MRNLFLSFILTAIAGIANAQVVIQGKIVDNDTDLPIADASVYLDRTTFGTSSTSQGAFMLEALGIYSGQLIVSAKGYECLTYKLDINITAKKMFKLKLVRRTAAKNILELPSDIRKQLLSVFETSLLGITEEADQCSIANLEAVYFVQGEDPSITYAYADTPLIIHNKLLGYEIAYDLVEFSDAHRKGNYFIGYSRYREMGDKKRWTKRRQLNYRGSSMHFLRSLINRDLYQQGFSLFQAKKAKQAIQPGKTNFFIVDPSSVEPIEPVNILFIDAVTNEYYLQFTMPVIVQYAKAPVGAYYLSNKGFVQGLNDKGFTAYINLNGGKVGIDINGAVEDPSAIEYTGFWNYEKLANQLPYNYQAN